MAINFNNAKWGAPQLGAPGGTVTWSFDETFDQSLFFGQGNLNDAMAESVVRLAFQLWESFANIDFDEIRWGSGATAAIRIGQAVIDGESGTLGQAQWFFDQSTSVYRNVAAEVTFDSQESWQAGTDGSGGGVNFFAVALHEIGHTLGLGHDVDPDSLMHYRLTDQRGPTLENRAALREIYGGRPQDTTVDVEAATSASQDVFRFFDTSKGTHFYTASAAERDAIQAQLPQYRLEGNAFDTVKPTEDSALDIFRFFNRDTGTHFYTSSESERDQVIATLSQYSYEGVAYQASSDDGNGAFDALYRFFDTANGTHFYTGSEEELISVLGALPQYRYEGIVAFVDFA